MTYVLRGLLPNDTSCLWAARCGTTVQTDRIIFNKICKSGVKGAGPDGTRPSVLANSQAATGGAAWCWANSSPTGNPPLPWNPYFLTSAPWPRASEPPACWGRHGMLMERLVAYDSFKFESRMSVLFPTNCYACKTQQFYFAKLWPWQTFLPYWSLPFTTMWRPTDWSNHSKITVSTKTATWEWEFCARSLVGNWANMQRRLTQYHFRYFWF